MVLSTPATIDGIELQESHTNIRYEFPSLTIQMYSHNNSIDSQYLPTVYSAIKHGDHYGGGEGWV